MRPETPTGIHSPSPHQVLEQKLRRIECCSKSRSVSSIIIREEDVINIKEPGKEIFKLRVEE